MDWFLSEYPHRWGEYEWLDIYTVSELRDEERYAAECFNHYYDEEEAMIEYVEKNGHWRA